MKKFMPVIIVIAILIVGFLGFQYMRSQGAAAAVENLQTAPVARGSLTASVGATGTVRANQTAVLAWQTTGTIETVSVKSGDQVDEGKQVAALKQNSLPQTVIMAQAELVGAQQDLDDLLLSDLPRVQALQALEDAQDALDDYAQNLAIRRADAQIALLAAQEALEDAENDRLSMDRARASQGTIDAAEANYQLAQNDVEFAQQNFDQFANRLENDPGRAAALAALAEAEKKRDRALSQLNWYKGEWSDEDIAGADATLSQAQANLEKARREWERLSGSRDSAELELLEAQLAEAQRTYEALQEGPPQNQIEAAEARVAAAQATVDTIFLAAPFPGTVTSISIKPGDQVSPGAVGVRIDDLSRLLVDVNVSEVDINRIEPGQPANLTFDAILGKTYKGTISEVAKVGDVVQGVVNFVVTVELTDFDKDVKPGMTAAVNIVVEQKEDALLVPNRAVRVVDGDRVVFVLRDGKMEQVTLKLGSSSETSSEVLEGDLKVGDLIVLNPPPVFDQNGPGFLR